jgi:hypothetical protein
LLLMGVAPVGEQTITAKQSADGVGLSAGDIEKVHAVEIVSVDVENS